MDATASIFHDRRREKTSNTYPVKLRVYSHNRTKFYRTKWDMSSETYESTFEARKPRGKAKDIKIEMNALLGKANSVIGKMEMFSFKDFERKLFRKSSDAKNIFSYFSEKIENLRKTEQFGTASSYGCAMESISSFHSGDKNKKKEGERVYPNIPFHSIDVEFLNNYEKWMLKEGNKLTTVGIYLRNLRALFKIAIQEGVVPIELYPFGKGKYEIPGSSSSKKALNKEEIKKLIDAKAENEHQEKARDFFLFSYLSSGMNMRDILELRFKDISKNTIAFYRSKTKRTTKNNKKPIIVGLGDIQKGIIKKYSTQPKDQDSYIFPIFTPDMQEEKKLWATQKFTRYVNQHIKKLGETAKIDIHISTYTARHSFTTNAIRNGAPMESISESLGHQSLITTQNYWKGFEESAKIEIITKLESDLK